MFDHQSTPTSCLYSVGIFYRLRCLCGHKPRPSIYMFSCKLAILTLLNWSSKLPQARGEFLQEEDGERELERRVWGWFRGTTSQNVPPKVTAEGRTYFDNLDEAITLLLQYFTVRLERSYSFTTRSISVVKGWGVWQHYRNCRLQK